MGKDEAGTLAALKALRTELIDPKVTEHSGRVFKSTGDGLLAEFPSVVNAVSCAVEIQRGIQARNKDLLDERAIRLRIGINLGDVIVEGDDMFGDGVNVAARIESIASPGDIAISGTVRDHIGNRLDLHFEDAGEQTLKNIDRPVRVYQVRMGSGPAKPALTLPGKPSIAVLPFQNMSGDPEQEYFADGMVEEIITALSRMRWLFVIARNSSFSYKGRAIDVKQIGRELGVRYVLEGSIRKAGGRVRITGQLIDASNGAHLWADRFDGALEDIFDLQDQVTTSVVGAISPKLEQAEIERARRKPTESLDAYDFYLRGLAAFYQWTRESNAEAVSLFTRATELDPNFAAAYGMTAHCYTQRKENGWMIDRAKEIAEAERLARRAVEIGRDDPVALCFGGLTLGYVLGNIEDGSAFVDRALALDPNMAAAWFVSSWLNLCKGELDTALSHVARALRLSPLDTYDAWRSDVALTHFCAGRYGKAVSWAEAALRDHPKDAYTLRVLSASYAMQGLAEAAQTAMAKLRNADPQLRLSNLEDVISPLQSEHRKRYTEGLRKAGLPE
jgi:adenylate cyclase